MALVPCKECESDVYVGAEVCPRCGVPKPGVSYEEERLMAQIKEARDEEDRYAEIYRSHMGNAFKEMIHAKKISENARLANEAQRRWRALDKELSDLRSRRIR